MMFLALSASELGAWTAAIMGVLGLIVVLTRPILRYWAGQRAAGKSVDLLGIALAFAEGYDAAKAQLPPESKATVSAALKTAAERAGVHDATTQFLERFGFNKPPA